MCYALFSIKCQNSAFFVRNYQKFEILLVEIPEFLNTKKMTFWHILTEKD